MAKKFQKRKEDFVCEHCTTEVVGNGYTNHCPRCIWSKHVDINPGDRASSCEGAMRAIDIEVKACTYTIVHQCILCGHKRKNKAVKGDSIDAMLAIQRGGDGKENR
ncbi:MAG: hypothetical protein BMS9Abin13_091 [Patescibacteria group bacterium]|nr:MAG: hypothetical protein BMS9Abin13_091 [Patescibacteria group bacterium]